MITVASDDLEGLATYFRTAADAAVPAMRMAINDVATRGGMALIREEMTDQIAFPRGYLTGDRIGVTKRATNASLEAVITGRKRATSLARFTSARTINQKGGVSVRVSRGRTTYLKQAWLVRLKKGASLDEDNYNIGLAVRLRPGEKLNKKTVHQSWLVAGQVALLYGPSVDQVFQEVAGDVVDPISEMVQDEFFRQFARLTSV